MACEPLRESVGTALGAHEDESETALGLEQLDELLHLVLVGDRDEVVVDLAGRVPVRELGLESRWEPRVGACQLADRSVERGREEHRLPLVPEQADDLVHLRLEAHVEHAVGLVEHEDRDRVEGDEPPVDQVLQAAGCGDEHVGLAGAVGLGAERHAAVHGGDGEAARASERLELLGHLHRELTRRDEHERRRPTGIPADALDDRPGEGERLARAGRGLGEHVTAAEGGGDDELLNLKRGVDAASSERADDVCAQPERSERVF